MTRKTRFLAHAALIAALYAALSLLQNLLLPGSAAMPIQFRISEALCVLALFTPAAIPGLAVGCLVFNLTLAGALPLDFLVGSLATGICAWLMRRTRSITVKGFPLPALLMPAAVNGLAVGWELSIAIGGGFLPSCAYVAAGEAAVLLTLGSLLYALIRSRRLDRRLFA